MISNTVIIFLRDLLPIFILFAYLSTMSRHTSKNLKFWVLSIIIGMILMLVAYICIEPIGQSFDGAGLELFNVGLLILTYVSLVSASLLPRKAGQQHTVKLLFMLGIATMVSLKGSQFLLYYGVYGHHFDNLYPIILGCTIGLGICASFAALMRFVLSEIYHSSQPWIFQIFWFAFLSGHLSQSIGYLSQVDLLSLGAPLINIDYLIQDSSEYGHVLHALLGYESSPSATFIGTYLVGLLAPMTIYLIRREHPNKYTISGVHP